MTDTYYYAADAKKRSRLHNKGHSRLVGDFTACGHPLGGEAMTRGWSQPAIAANRCAACAKQKQLREQAASSSRSAPSVNSSAPAAAQSPSGRSPENCGRPSLA